MKTRLFTLSIAVLALAFLPVSCRRQPVPEEKPAIEEENEKPPVDIGNHDTPEGEYTVSDNTVFLSEDYVSTVTSNGSDGDKTFFQSTSASQPQTGQILISNTISEAFPAGFLGRVTSVDGARVYYEKVKLEEAFTELKIDEQNLDLGNNLARIVDANGKDVPFSKTKAVAQGSVTIAIPKLTWDIAGISAEQNGYSIGGKLQVTPEMSFTLGSRFQAIIDDGKVLAMNILLDPEFHVGATISAAIEAGVSGEILIYKMYFTPVVLGALIFVPKVTLKGYVSLSGRLALETEFSYDSSYSFGAGYETGDWRLIFREREGNTGSSPAISSIVMEGALEIGLKPGYDFRLYDIFGVNVNISGGIKNSVSSAIDLSDPDMNVINNICLTTSFVARGQFNVDAEVAGESIYSAFSETSPEYSKDLSKIYIVPELVSESLVINPTGMGADISGKFKRQVFESFPVYAKVYKMGYKDGKWQTIWEDYIECDCKYPQSEDEEGTLSCKVSGLEATNETYYVDLVTKIGGSYILLAGTTNFFGHFLTFDVGQSRLLANLIRKVSAAFGLDEVEACTWKDVDEYNAFGQSGVRAALNDDGKINYVVFRIPKGWERKYPSRIRVDKSFSEGFADDFSWDIQNENMDAMSEITDFYCDDPKFNSSQYIIGEAPQLESIEFHGCEVEFFFYDKNYPNLKKIYLKDCKIITDDQSVGINLVEQMKSVQEIDIIDCSSLDGFSVYSNGTKVNLPRINLSGTPVNWVSIWGAILQGSEFITMPPSSSLSLTDCKGNIVLPDCKTIRISREDDPGVMDLTVKISGLEHLESCGFSAMQAVSISDCAKLKFVTMYGVFYEDAPYIVTDNVSISGCALLDNVDITARTVGISNCTSLKDAELTAKNVSVTSCPALTSLTVYECDRSADATFSGLGSLMNLGLGYMSGIVPAVVDEVRSRGGNVNYVARYSYDSDYMGNYYVTNDYGFGLYYQGEPGRGYHYPKPANL